MLKIYNTDIETNKLKEVKEFSKGCWINMVNPSEDEIKTVCENVGIQDEFIRYPLDFEEKARIEEEEDDNTILFVVDIPIIENSQDGVLYSTMPLGMIVVRDDYFITVSLRKNKVIEDFEKQRVKGFQTFKKTRFIFQILYCNASYYLDYLKKMNKETEVAEKALKHSLKNEDFLKMLTLEKGLVYFSTSLKSNELVMEKTLRGRIIKLYDEDEDILEDAITENRQAMEMSKIYTDILTGTMDAYASIISNNLNVVMKTLTSITIILAIPTVISSFWGMNVKVPFENTPYAFGIIAIIAIVITLLTSFWLNKKNMLK